MASTGLQHMAIDFVLLGCIGLCTFQSQPYAHGSHLHRPVHVCHLLFIVVPGHAFDIIGAVWDEW